MSVIRKFLQHPLTRDMDLDDPETTSLRRRIIQTNPLLKEIYAEWYAAICRNLPGIDGPVLEIGSGAGFLEQKIPGLVRSDIMKVPGNHLVCDAMGLPFQDNSLRAIVFVNVLHHICDPTRFFHEAERVVRREGAIILIEPWVTAWSSLIYNRFHHEPFDPRATEWSIPESGPLSGGNDALPWIIFERDREKFHQLSNWRVKEIGEMMPFRYLLSGGVSMRRIWPAFLIAPLTKFEQLLPRKILRRTAMFASVVLVRKTR